MDKDVVRAHTHTHTEILLDHRKEWNIVFLSNTNKPKDYHTKLSKSDEKDKYHMV